MYMHLYREHTDLAYTLITITDMNARGNHVYAKNFTIVIITRLAQQICGSHMFDSA